MKNENYSAAVIRRRKMLLALPVLVLPFITLAFWAMGGGRDHAGASREERALRGLNLQLPDAKFRDDKAMNKLGYYDKAAHDSVKREELVRNDPYHKIKTLAMPDSSSADSIEARAYQRIAALDKVLNEKNAARGDGPEGNLARSNDGNSKGSVETLRGMMEDMQHAKSPGDPDVEKLNGMLDKIMDIQHPERLSEAVRIGNDTRKEHVLPVTGNQPRNNISLLVDERSLKSPLAPVTDSGFFSTSDKPGETNNDNAINAVIHETRRVVNGSVIKFRLCSDIYINGVQIPKGNFIYGKASLNGERLNIDIHSIRYRNSLYPVSLNVYDLDGMDGVFIPGAITRDVAKESSDRAIQGIALNSLDPSIGAQAAGAGIEAAKNLLTRKIKLVRVVVKAGYHVLLKEKH
ncbi:MAG: conjugative transposon protein TraM [Bacteroidota bacterium]